MKKIILILIGILLFYTSCNTTPNPIDYGSDGCHYCQMTIVDKLHAAELITHKGKAFKFDATECMINYMSTIDTTTVASYLSTDYAIPEALIDATTATYLITKEIPSPMGAYLSAFKNKEKAIATQKEKGGDVYTWNELLVKFKR